MSGVRFLLGKDLRILRRSPLLVSLLVAYPVLIAVLIGLALSKGPDKPRVAIVNQLPQQSEEVAIAGTTVKPADYANELFEAIVPVRVRTREEAVRKVRDGDVLAAIIVPPDLVTRLQKTISLSGTGPKPAVEVLYNAEDPVKQQFVQSTIDARVADLNKVVSTKLTQIAAGYLDILLSGGKFSVLGRDFDIAGLKKSKTLIDSVLTRTPEGSPDHAALQRVSRFAQLAIDNLDLSDTVLSSLATPVKVNQTIVKGRRTPLDAFAVTVAVTMSLMLVGVLLAAGMLALEREEHAFARLVRGLVSRTGLLVEKVVLAAGCAAAVTVVMVAGVSLFHSLDWSRSPLWVVALAPVAWRSARWASRSGRWRARCGPRRCWRSCSPCRSRSWRWCPAARSPKGSMTRSAWSPRSSRSAPRSMRPTQRSTMPAASAARWRTWPRSSSVGRCSRGRRCSGSRTERVDLWVTWTLCSTRTIGRTG